MYSANPYVAWARLTELKSDAPEAIFIRLMEYLYLFEI